MKAIEILYNLSPYQSFLEELSHRESKEKPDWVWTRNLSSQYNFITLELQYTSSKDSHVYPQTAVKITFEIQRGIVVMTEVYCEEQAKKEVIEKLVKDNKAIHEARWHTEPNNTWYHDEKVTAYINMADEIAQAAYNCSSGDDYGPGHFSEIKINETGIVLSQINWHNAKSIDHKNDYTMRNLVLYIPVVEERKMTSDDDFQIGAMHISFSDRSSATRKVCGQKIVEQILQQKTSFEKSEK